MINRKEKILYSFVLVFVLLVQFFVPVFTVRTVAASSYSGVLDDLQKDENFNPDDYPSISDDYSIQVIQVAEGTNGELFVYTYTPSNETNNFQAKKINIAFQEPSDESLTFSLYDLKLVSTQGVFDKYQIEGYSCTYDQFRYYNIATIYRPFDSLIDEGMSSIDDIKDYVGFAVGKCWCLRYSSNGIEFDCKNVETVNITIHAVGFTKYYDGFIPFQAYGWTDSHFIAFSIDNFDVDAVYSAKISFKTKQYTAIGQDPDNLAYAYIDNSEMQHELILDCKDVGMNEGNGWFGKKYKWSRISTKKEFIDEIEDHTNTIFSDEQKLIYENSQFVFRFLETRRSESDSVMGMALYGEVGTSVTEVAVLQLQFLSDSKVYNLGVVGDIASDDGKADFVVDAFDNIQNMLEEWGEWFEKIIQLLLFVLLFCGLLMIKPVFKFFEFVFKGIYNFIKVILKVILFPLRVFRKK